MKPLALLVAALALSLTACFPETAARDPQGAPEPTPFAPATAAPAPAAADPTAAPPTTRPAGPATPPKAAPTATPEPVVAGPVGFPLDPKTRPWRVVDTAQGRTLQPPLPDGPTVLDVARESYTRATNDQEANRYGWDCRTHAKYEGYPALDWYLDLDTPVLATMDAKAELYVIYYGNSFKYYGVNANLYLGLPPPNLPLYPFSGDSGGMGVFVSVYDGTLRAEYGHLDPAKTIAAVPDGAFLAPYSKGFNFEARFNKPLGPNDGTLVASWPVKRGQVVGFVGNSGYSDVPHLHYQIITPDRSTKYCPSEEPLPFSGWLFRRPDGFPY